MAKWEMVANLVANPEGKEPLGKLNVGEKKN
jgi:hypothetical protein